MEKQLRINGSYVAIVNEANTTAVPFNALTAPTYYFEDVFFHTNLLYLKLAGSVSGSANFAARTRQYVNSVEVISCTTETVFFGTVPYAVNGVSGTANPPFFLKLGTKVYSGAVKVQTIGNSYRLVFLTVSRPDPNNYTFNLVSLNYVYGSDLPAYSTGSVTAYVIGAK